MGVGRRTLYGSGCRGLAAWLIAIVSVALCGAGGHRAIPKSRTARENLNLIFVPSADQNPATGDLSNEGLDRSLRLGEYLRNLINWPSVRGIYSLKPASHLVGPDARNPDFAPLETIEQFSLLYSSGIDVRLDYTDLGSDIALIEEISRTNRQR